jgi:cell division protein FtsI (penicillin-binding protein 3)
MQNLDPRRARWIKVRMGLLCGLMGVGLGLIVSGAYNVQVEEGPEWREIAEKQRQRRLHVAPKRGSMYDRNGTPLAVSVEVPSISLDAVELLRGADEKRALVLAKDASMRIAQALHVDAADIEERIVSHRRFSWIKRRVSKDEVEAVRALGDPKSPLPIRGLGIEGEGHRFYPNRELGGPLLGFVSPDGEGKDGLELELDEELRGHAEEVRGLRDRAGHLLFSDGVQDEQALAGHNVYLTIDQGIQYTAEQELDAAVRTYEAKGGSAVVVDPNTGEVLALANSPGYNPNDYFASDIGARRNRALTDRFEPGSTMKVFTLASALAARTLDPTRTIDCEGGVYRLDNVVIHDTHQKHDLTPTQVLAVSSNIGAAKIGLGLGESQLYEGFRRFGFGEPTGLPLPGESSGVLRARGRPWVEVETAIASFGHGISVTTIQLAMALSAIANGGRLLEPLLIRRVTDGAGNVVREGVPHVRREVVSSNVARTMAEMMVAVTEGEGTGVEASIPGFRVAGKTATAQKADPATGRYTTDRFTSSFIGFVPAERPRIAIAVVLDEPAVAHAGAFVAAPAFRRIAEMSLRYLGVTPRGTAPAALSAVGDKPDPAEKTYALLRPPSPEITSGADAVAAPVASAASPVGSAAANGPASPADVRIPDLQGLGVREALRAVVSLGLVPSVEGTGALRTQQPAAGTGVPKGASVKLVFEPST